MARYELRFRKSVAKGKFRILYEIYDERLIVTVVKIAHRKHIYRR